MKKYFIIDLFSGAHSWSKPWRDITEKVLTLDILPELEPDICMDILDVDDGIIDKIKSSIPEDAVVVLYASPPCTAFSVASIRHHWTGVDKLMVGYRRYEPKSDRAEEAIEIVKKTIKIIESINPDYFWIENPRGLLRKLKLFPEEYSHAQVWYCQYGDDRAKPTDLWGRWPDTWKPRPKCNSADLGGKPVRGEKCHHVSSPRGANAGTQARKGWLARSEIPEELVLDTKQAVIDACESGSQ